VKVYFKKKQMLNNSLENTIVKVMPSKDCEFKKKESLSPLKPEGDVEANEGGGQGSVSDV
jgi:hypothetical protein